MGTCVESALCMYKAGLEMFWGAYVLELTGIACKITLNTSKM